MEDDPTTSADNILNSLLNSTSPEAVQAGMLLQNQSFGFVAGQLTGFLGNLFLTFFPEAYLQQRSALDAILDIVTGINEAVALINSIALPSTTRPDELTVGDVNGTKAQMEAFFATNPDLAFVADIVADPFFLQFANPATVPIVTSVGGGDPSVFLAALDIGAAFFDGFDPTALAFAAIAANAPPVIRAEARDDGTEDPVAPDDPTDPDDPANPDDPVDDTEDPVAPDEPSTSDNSGDDNLTGDDGPDTLDGGEGDDALTGGGGRDNLIGGAGKDTLDGGGGADNMSGGRGADEMSGRGGKDVMTGGAGRDTMEGGGGRDEMFGGGGADQMSGGGGRDAMEGGAGKDVLNGGGGRDMIKGGGGSDTIMGGRGRDTLEGGGGKDTFWFLSGDRNDTITDFNFRRDKVIINDPSRAGKILEADEFALQILFGEEEEDLLVTILGTRDSPRKTVIRLEDTKVEDFNTDAFEFGDNDDGELGDGDPIL